MSKLELQNLAALQNWIGKEFPKGDWLTVTQDMINDFAKATLDFQWIHVDVEKANQYSPFKKPVAHGFLSLSLLSKMLSDLIQVRSVTMGVNYGLNKVRFPSPVVVDSRVMVKGHIKSIETYAENGVKVTWNCTVAIEGGDKPACVAEFVSLMFE